MIFLGNTNTVVDVRKGLEPIQKIMNGSTEIFNGIPTEQQYVFRQSAGNGVCYIRTLEGKSLVWNQLVRNGNFADTTAWSSITVSNNVGTITPTVADSNCQLRQFITKSKDHKYYIRASLKFSDLSHLAADRVDCLRHIWYGTSNLITNLPLPSADDTWRDYSFVITGNADYNNAEFNFIVLYKSAGAQEGDTMSAKNIYCLDLTLMFGSGNEPSTVEEFEALFPNSYYAYNAGTIISNNADSIETVGFNQWDEEWESGGLIASTGENIDSSVQIRSKNYIPVIPGRDYYFPSSVYLAIAYDNNKEYTRDFKYNLNNTVNTLNSNECYVRFCTYTTYGTTYNHDICINLSDASRNGTYEPYWKKSIQLGLNAFRVTDGTNVITVNGLKSAGSVYDEIDPVRKKYIKRIGEVDMGTFTWTKGSGPRFITELPTGAKIPAYSSIPNAICQKYSPTPSTINFDTANGVFAITDNQFIVADNSYSDAATFKAAMSGVPLYYELVTPVEYDLVDDIPNAIEVDENGTERATFPVRIDGAPSAPFRCQSNYYLTSANVED